MAASHSIRFLNFAFLRRVHWEEKFGPRFIRLAQPRCVVQEPNQVAVRIQVILLYGFNQTINHSAGLSASRGVGKEPVLPAYDKGLYAALGTVVGELQPAVLQISAPP